MVSATSTAWLNVEPETEAKLEMLAEVLGDALGLPLHSMLTKRVNSTLVARQAFVYCANTFLDVTRDDVAAFLGINTKECGEHKAAFLARIDGTELNDFEDADEDLCEAIENVAKVLASQNNKESCLAVLDEQSLKALGRITPNRRFEEKPNLNPGAVRALASDHPALLENRTLFPTTVVTVMEDEPARLLVSGKNNRKLGDVVARGAFRGYAIYGLSLEERATCPSDCAVRAVCYGNGMQMARRHRIGDPDIFYSRLSGEVHEILTVEGGLLVRLHVLGDFPSVDYVAHWADLLDEHKALACYGYTHRRTTSLGGDDIGDAIDALKRRFPERFRIRWSRLAPAPDSAVVIDYVPDGPKAGTALVCPAQTDATACCASCGLCWEAANTNTAIAFIKHGPKYKTARPEEKMEVASMTDERPVIAPLPTRRVQPISVPGAAKRAASVGAAPIVRVVNPNDLHIEGSYQRELTKRSLVLIRKIVNDWDWTKFKPPICAKRDGGNLVVIDGQHTAIAAATLAIPEIPILLVRAEAVEGRANSFVSHNRDRLVMSPLQIFHASVVAGDKAAIAVAEIAATTGIIIPRSSPTKNRPALSQVTAINDVVAVYKRHGADVLRRIFTIAVMADCSHLSRAATRGLAMALTAPYFEKTATMKDSHIGNSIRPMEAGEGLDKLARIHAAESDMTIDRAAATLIAKACEVQGEILDNAG